MDLLSTLYFALLVMTLVSYIVLFEKRKPYKQYILLYCVLDLFASLIAFYLAYTPAKNNLVVFHVFTVVEYAVLSLLYVRELENKMLKKMIRLSIPFFALVCFLLALFVQKINENNSYAIIIESILLVCYSLFFLRELLLRPEIPSLLSYPMFWISVAILFYFVGNLLVEGLLNYFMHYSMELALRLYKLTYVFTYLLFILFTIAVFSEKFNRKTFNAG